MRTLVIVLLVAVAGCSGDPETAEELVARSISFHDPGAVWNTQALAVALDEKRPDGSMRKTMLERWPLRDSIILSQQRGDVRIGAELSDGLCGAAVDGAAPDSSQVAAWRLSCPDGIRWWKDYYEFMHGLPMKLADEGTLIDPAVTDTVFMGQAVRSVRVTYSPEVGADSWYFYFRNADAALVGARFYHDEAANDGEYIQFDADWISITGNGPDEALTLRLPRSIHWYVNADDRFLGTDSLTSVALVR